MDMSLTPTKVFSFFSGSGLLDLGFEAEGFDVSFVNEKFTPFLDAYKYTRQQPALTDALNLPDVEATYSNSSIEDILRDPETDNFLELVTLAKQKGLVGFIGGPPCPDFSVGGKNRGAEGEKGQLTKTYVDLICQHKPDFFVLENVKGLMRTKKHKAFLDEQLAQLKKAGYEFRVEILNAISFEVPQDRDRVIILGLLKKRFLGAKKILAKLNWGEVYDRETILSMSWPKRSKFVEDGYLPPPNNIYLHLTAEHWFKSNDVDNHPNSKHHFIPRAALPKFQVVEEGDTDKKSYKRLHRWRYSPTAAYGNNEVHLHPNKARRLSAAESLAIQSMPKEFVLPPNMTLSNMFKTIGNGVPFLMGRAIARAVKNVTNGDLK